MSGCERTLRFVGQSAFVCSVATPPLWIVGLVHPFAVLALVFACINAALFGVWYAFWAMDASGEHFSRASFLGAGDGLFMARPYFVFGSHFRRRVRVRRVRQLERACGLDYSAFSEWP